MRIRARGLPIPPSGRWLPKGRHRKGGTLVEASYVFSMTPVYKAFLQNFADGCELEAQLCVLVDGEPVVDLCATSRRQCEREYGAESPSVVFSTGKVLESLVVAFLVERGAIPAYSSTVASLWPEFGQHGKQHVTVADLMRHDGGLPFFSDSKLSLLDVDADADGSAIARAVCGSALTATGRQYHAISRGLVLDGLCLHLVQTRICDLIELLCHSVGAQVWCSGVRATAGSAPLSAGGCPDEPPEATPKVAGVAEVADPPWWWLLLLWLLELLKLVVGPQLAFRELLRQPDPPVLSTPLDFPLRAQSFFNGPAGERVQLSSVTVHSSARALARAGTELLGNGLLSPETTDAALAAPRERFDAYFAARTAITQGGLGLLSRVDRVSLGAGLYHPQHEEAAAGFHGWSGWGGSALLVDRARGVVVAYVPTSMGAEVSLRRRGARGATDTWGVAGDDGLTASADHVRPAAGAAARSPAGEPAVKAALGAGLVVGVGVGVVRQLRAPEVPVSLREPAEHGGVLGAPHVVLHAGHLRGAAEEQLEQLVGDAAHAGGDDPLGDPLGGVGRGADAGRHLEAGAAGRVGVHPDLPFDEPDVKRGGLVHRVEPERHPRRRHLHQSHPHLDLDVRCEDHRDGGPDVHLAAPVALSEALEGDAPDPQLRHGRLQHDLGDATRAACLDVAPHPDAVDVALRFGDQPPLHAAGGVRRGHVALDGCPRHARGNRGVGTGEGGRDLVYSATKKTGFTPRRGRPRAGRPVGGERGGGEAAYLLTRSTASAACPPSIHARRHYLLRMIACIVGTSLLMVDDSCFTKL